MSQRHKILIVDDDAEVLLVTKMSLKRAEYDGKRFKLITANSGQEAVETVRQTPDIAVIIIDQIMETDNAGTDACQQIRQELGQTRPRLILRSGLADERTTGDAHLATLGLSCVLPKSEMTPESLVQSLHEALDDYYAL